MESSSEKNEKLERKLNEHIGNIDQHIKLKELNELFVPRTENNIQFQNIQTLFERIDKKIDRLDERIKKSN